MNKCPICESIETVNFFDIEKYPVINMPLSEYSINEITKKYSKDEIYSDLKTEYCKK